MNNSVFLSNLSCKSPQILPVFTSQMSNFCDTKYSIESNCHDGKNQVFASIKAPNSSQQLKLKTYDFPTSHYSFQKPQKRGRYFFKNAIITEDAINENSNNSSIPLKKFPMEPLKDTYNICDSVICRDLYQPNKILATQSTATSNVKTGDSTSMHHVSKKLRLSKESILVDCVNNINKSPNSKLLNQKPVHKLQKRNRCKQNGPNIKNEQFAAKLNRKMQYSNTIYDSKTRKYFSADSNQNLSYWDSQLILSNEFFNMQRTTKWQQIFLQQNIPVPCNLTFRIPRSPTARAAIVLYPYPPVSLEFLPELKHAHHQALFLQYARQEPNPLKVQLAHFVIEHCTRSLPDNLFRSESPPDCRIISEFVDQILHSVEIFWEQAFQINACNAIPLDINEVYISNWLQEKQHMLKPLEILHQRRQQKHLNYPKVKTLEEQEGKKQKEETRYTKSRRKIGVFLGEELDALGIPKSIHHENLRYAIANRGLVVQLPSHTETSSTRLYNATKTYSTQKSSYKRSLFNLLIAGRGDTRRSKLELPWGEIVKIKYNRTLLGIPDFVVEALLYASCNEKYHFEDRPNLQHIIPKVCAVSLEDSFYGVEILLFYRGMPCSKRFSKRNANSATSLLDSCHSMKQSLNSTNQTTNLHSTHDEISSKVIRHATPKLNSKTYKGHMSNEIYKFCDAQNPINCKNEAEQNLKVYDFKAIKATDANLSSHCVFQQSQLKIPTTISDKYIYTDSSKSQNLHTDAQQLISFCEDKNIHDFGNNFNYNQNKKDLPLNIASKLQQEVNYGCYMTKYCIQNVPRSKHSYETLQAFTNNPCEHTELDLPLIHQQDYSLLPNYKSHQHDVDSDFKKNLNTKEYQSYTFLSTSLLSDKIDESHKDIWSGANMYYNEQESSLAFENQTCLTSPLSNYNNLMPTLLNFSKTSY